MGAAKSGAKQASGDLWDALYGTGAEAYPYVRRIGEYGEDQLQKYYNMLQSSMDTYNNMLSREQETFDRYNKIWSPVEQAQASDAMADLQAYRPVKDAGYQANLEQLQRRSLYYPLEEQTIGAAQDELALSQESRDRYRANAPGLIDNLVQGANVDSDLMGNMAANDVTSQLYKQQEATDRGMTRMGINPNSAKFADASANADIMAAAQGGAARTRGRLEGDNLQFTRSGQALNALAPTSSTGTAAQVGNAGLTRSLVNFSSSTPDLLSATKSYAGNPSSFRTDFGSLLGSGMTGLSAPVNYYTGQQKQILDFFGTTNNMAKNASEKEDSGGGWGSAVGGGLSAIGSIAGALIM